MSMQAHSFTNVDLSSNKLSGTLLGSLQPPSESLNLTVNRLSGKIPSSLRSTGATVNILEGNLFGCPQLVHDEYSSSIPCGSSNLEVPLVTWLVLMALMLIAVIYLLYCSKISIIVQVQHLVSGWWSISSRLLSPADASSNSDNLYHTRSTIRYLDYACSMTLLLAVLLTLVVMMSYIGMKLRRTDVLYQVQYLYTTTSAYLVGLTPTLLIWLYVSVSGVTVVALCVSGRLSSRRTQSDIQRIDDITDAPKDLLNYQYIQDTVKSNTILMAVEIVVSAIVVGINYGFVQIVYFSSPSNLTLVNLAFAIIKSLTSVIVVPYSSSLVPRAFKQSYTVLMTIMVSVIGPGLAVLLSSPLCLFYYIMKRKIFVSFLYPQAACSLLGECTVISVASSTSIEPQWFYSYQCSSSYLTSYLPNFIYLYIITGIISPLVSLVAMVLISTGVTAKITNNLRSCCFNFTSNSQRCCCMSFNFLSKFIDDKLSVGRIFYISDDSTPIPGTSKLASRSTDVNQSLPPSSVEMAVLGPIDRMIVLGSSESSTYDIEVADLMPSLCVDITMLMTFGVASPVFAVVVSCRIIINTLLWRLALGRYISIVSKATSSRVCYDKLERAFENEWRCLPRSWWMMSVFIGMFWSLFVNDMIGDKDPVGGIVAAVMMMMWCPLVLISLQRMLSVSPDSDSTSSGSSTVDGTRNRVHSMSSYIHDMVWKHVLRLDNTTAVDGGTSSSFSGISINETISPLGSFHSTTTNIVTSTATSSIARSV